MRDDDGGRRERKEKGEASSVPLLPPALDVAQVVYQRKKAEEEKIKGTLLSKRENG